MKIMGPDFKSAYKSITEDHFPNSLEISFVDENGRQTLFYEKVKWSVAGVKKSLRYGENPGQEAVLYKLINGNLALGEVSCIRPGKYLAADVELLQSGKHPGKTNITDVDSALNILRYLTDVPCTVIVKHNNPCGAARAATLAESYRKAYLADRLVAFGGVIALNREVDRETAGLIANQYCEVVAAPGFASGVLDILAGRKNLRVMRIGNMAGLQDYVSRRVVELKSLIDGGIIAQWSFESEVKRKEDFIPARAVHGGKQYIINRCPTEREYEDLLFGWLVEWGITSNSVIYVKDGVTLGIGKGEQDRVGVAEIARDKARRKLADRLCWEKHRIPNSGLTEARTIKEIDREVETLRGGLTESCMVSDAFFPFRDGVDVGIREGVTAIVQPGGSERDFESIEACNEAGVAMVFTGQRCFRH